MTRCLVSFLIALLPLAAVAKYQDFSTYAGMVSLELAPLWKVHKNIWGLPLSFVAPMQSDGTRPVVTLVGAKEKHAPIRAFKKDGLKIAQDEFKKEKTLWAKTKDARAQSFAPPELRQLGQGSMIVLSQQYERKSRRYTQVVYKVLCNEQYYHGVALVTAANEHFLTDINKMMNGLKCL